MTSGTDIEISKDKTEIELFNRPYFPEVQAVLIAINLKGKVKDLKKTEVVKKLFKKETGKRKKKRKGIEDKIPTIKHGDKVLRGEIDCIEYIDKTFGQPKDFYPPEYSTTLANLNLYC